ncbi:hypothetical protein ACIRP2_30705 [Streptomyces sp. NPDC101194]|uniref:hypothetical protein n=1 Tax=Streptomyces sp. NPDC101194 TaxID=3366127 RepID=UPI0037FCE7A3
MDHRETDTTLGYYKVSLERKRTTGETVARMTTDRHGNGRGFSDAPAYEGQTAAVPHGGCSEPSNVKAGGQHCRIRFQCAGCDFYPPILRTCRRWNGRWPTVVACRDRPRW